MESLDNFNDNVVGDIIENNIIKNCNIAINCAKKLDKVFDYSENSIKDLEEILEYYSKYISANNFNENQIWNIAVTFGSYLGEVMLKNGLSKKGYKWGNDNNSSIPLLINSNGYITPIDKVYKRFVNGKEDSIISFYDVMMEKI